MQVGEHDRPILGWHVLHGVDGQDRVELRRVRQVLQRNLLERGSDPSCLRLREHPCGLVIPTTRRPAAATVAKYRPVPHGASSTTLPDGTRPITRSTHCRWLSPGYSLAW